MEEKVRAGEGVDEKRRCEVKWLKFDDEEEEEN